MGTELLSVTIAAFCTMFGPGKALRSAEGAQGMHIAVEYMEIYARYCFMFAMIGLISFHMSSFMMIWATNN
jgi:hypothetical protein